MNGEMSAEKAPSAPISQAIGRTSATERDPTTSDKFRFWLTPGVIVNPFDIVVVDQVNQPGQLPSKTYGLVTMLEHRTDASNDLANFISSNFGELSEEPNTPRQGTTVAFASVLSNSADVYMPLPSERPVYFADGEGIQQALGTDALLRERKHDAIPAGLIKMSNGAAAVAYLDRRYVLGPESAHVNISGISGLATKTSYAMFLIQSILQKAPHPEQIAVIILNVKQADLLQIDRRPERSLPPEQMELWEALGLEPKPFQNVHYFLPRGHNGQANSYPPVPDVHTLYAYDLEGTADKLDMLFSNVADPSGTMEGIYGEIMAGITGRDAEFRNVLSWGSLLGFLLEKQQEGKRWRGMFASSSIGAFRRHLRRIVQTRQTGIFVDSRSRNEKLLSKELVNIRGGHVYVVDIAKLADEEQTLVFGDILRTIYAVKAEEAEARSVDDPIPEKVIVFVDELNKYAPSGDKASPITQQVLDVAERGRSLGVILISAQQFMSAVHKRVTGNCATKILGRTGSAEVMQEDYRFLEQDLKMAVTRLAKGELLVSHPVYRQPVRVIFPLPAYRQEQ
ncbi:MAG: ATP-binding protein, partial [Anaerolineae bacterium]|nr:ATP-binding protein [Anaerolineae bacterium]MDW8072317.1 ATP-binding protein [Anaerolineae bacterium]